MKAQKAITPFRGQFTKEYINYLSRLNTGGVTLPSRSRQFIDNNFILQLVGGNTYSTNVWNKIYLCQLWCAETKNAILYNLQNDTTRPNYNDYAVGAFINSGGVFTTSVGYDPNASEPIDTNFIPNTHLSTSGYSFEIWYSNQTNGINFGADYGVLGTGQTTLLSAYQSWNGGASNNCEIQISSSTNDYCAADENDLIGIWRSYIDSGGYVQISKNMVDFTMRDATDTPTAKATSELYFGSLNNGGSVLFPQTRQKSFYLITEELTSTEADALFECLDNYLTSLGI